MNSKHSAIKSKIDDRFAKNPFAKKMKATNDAKEMGRHAEKIEKGMHPSIKRK